MKQNTNKREFIITKRNGRCYRVFLKDLISIRLFKKKQCPKVPSFA